MTTVGICERVMALVQHGIFMSRGTKIDSRFVNSHIARRSRSTCFRIYVCQRYTLMWQKRNLIDGQMPNQTSWFVKVLL